MALAPVPAGPGAVPPPALGAAGPAATPMDTPVEETEDTAEPEVVATILRNADGTLSLQRGDEPEPGMEGEPGAEPETFPDGPALMRALMGLLGDGAGAEEAFAGGFRGDKGNTMPSPKEPPARAPM